jgi:hypothetical protein
MKIKDFFYFIAELEAPFIEIAGLRSTNMDEKEPGWLLNTEKGYKIKIYKLFCLVKGLKICIELDENKEAYVKFEDVTKAIVFRAFKRDKDKKNIESMETTTTGMKEGSKKKAI